MTLVEVLVVVAIMSLIAAAVGVAAFRHWVTTQVETATTNARAIRTAVMASWVLTGDTGCPTYAELLRDHAIDAGSPRNDPWGKPWRIECSESEVSVSSEGPDRTPGTEDDVHVPPLTRAAPEIGPGDRS